MYDQKSIADVAALEDLLSDPSPAATEALGRLDGDLLFLGVGGKMGPTLARMARRASDVAGKRRKIFGAARFTDPRAESSLREHGIEPIRCDLLDPVQLARLPDVPNVVFMTGQKFGTSGAASMSWAMNAYLPGMVCERFRASKIVAFSTGNVYGLSPVLLGGSVEDDPLRPVGEYALSAVGRERIFEHFSRTLGIPMALLRLNYAVEMRYGVLVDLAKKVWAGEPISLAMGNANVIWQGDANAMTLAAFDHLSSPPTVLNLAGPETLSVRRVAEEFAHLLNKTVTFEGVEGPDALLSNGQKAQGLFGYPRVPVRQMMLWIADWVRRGGPDLGKPTHFESREGKF